MDADALDDAALVAAARGGDGSAWALVYDRYADKLHDHCHRILRDRDEAADALHDAFVKASLNLEQLRDPSRLRPWLYSICRHEALRRARKRSRVELTDEVDDMTGVEVDVDRGARAEELQALVWSAAAGLNERDQALLDLSVRQGLEGQDLADAMGTSLSSSYVMLSRLRDQVERSLGALLIARLGRDDCTELDGILAGWDGRFSPLLRKRVARHVDGCDTCSERRKALVSPMALLAAAPLVPAPSGLRDRVLGGIDRGSTLDGAESISFTREGFAAADSGRRATGTRGWLLGAVAAALLVVAGLVAVLADGDHTEVAAIGSEPSSTTATTDAAVTTTDPDATTTTTVAAAGPATTAPEVAPPPGGPAGPPATDPPVIVTPPPTAPPDRMAPAVSNVTQSHSMIFTTSCPPSYPRRVTVTVTVTDTALESVVLRWSGGPGPGQVPMTASGSTYGGSFGDFAAGGDDLTFQVVARDQAGNETASDPRPVVLQVCPG